MKQKIQSILTFVLIVFAGIVTGSCQEDWVADADEVLTDSDHGGLLNGLVVVTGAAKNITHNSATILFSANYNYKESLGIKPSIIYGKWYSTGYDSNYKLEYYGSNRTIIEIEDFNSSECEVTLTNLQPSTTYYYRAHAEVNQYRHSYGEVMSFTTSAAPAEPIDYSVGEAVDLGLSVKWASKNIGATQPEESGVKFYWGGTEPVQSKYSPDWHDFTLSTLKSHGYVDSDNNLCPPYDAAKQKWGGKWRMPSIEECRELVDKCSWKQITRNGRSVYLVTGPNSNVIYMPVTSYWTATSYSGTSSYWAYESYYLSSSKSLYSTDRNEIYSIRPVSK